MERDPNDLDITRTGTTSRLPFPGLNAAEKERHFGELAYPNLMLSLSMDHVAMFILWPQGPEHTRIDCRLLFHPEAINHMDFDPTDAADFWDLVNMQDWDICERVQRGMHARPFPGIRFRERQGASRILRPPSAGFASTPRHGGAPGRRR